MSRSRTKKASFNILSSTLLEVIKMISGFILPRYILKYYGSSYNGITSSAAQFLGMISILTLGVTASTRVGLYRALADKDIKKTSAIIKATQQYMRKVALVLGVYIVVLALVYPTAVDTGHSYWNVAFLIMIIGMSSFAEYFFGITYRTFLLADQCVYISNLFTCVSVILSTGISIVLVTRGHSIQTVKFFSALVYVLRPLLQNIYVTKKYKLDLRCEPDKTAIKKRGDAMMHALANIVHDNTDIIVITLLLDVKIVSVYTVYNLVMSSLKKIQAIFTSDTEPIFGSMWANKEFDKIGKNLGIFECFANSFNAIAFGTAMVMILPFIHLYVPKSVKDVNYILPVYAVVISLAFATQGMRVPYLSLVQGIGHYKETKVAAIIEAILNISISVILVNFIGIVGVALGTLTANVYRTVHYALYIEKNVVKRGVHVFLMKFAWTMACIAAVVIPGRMVVQHVLIDGWFAWFLVASLVFLYASILVFIAAFVFYRKDVTYAFTIAKNMISRKGKKAK